MQIKEVKSETAVEKTSDKKPQKRDLRLSRERNKQIREQLYAENRAKALANKGKRGRPKKEPPKVSSRRGEIREAQNELTSVLRCQCGASYVHSLTNETNTTEEKSAYVCSVHNKGCDKKTPQRKLDADYMEFVLRASMFMAIKVGKPLPIYFKDTKSSDITEIESKVRKYETDSLKVEDFIKAEPSVRRILYMMSMRREKAQIEDKSLLFKDSSMEIHFTNGIIVQTQLYQPNKHSLSDMDFYLFDSVRREGKTKDGRPIRLPSEKKLLESGTFHSDHSIAFTHHTADRFIKNRKPLTYEGFSEDYWNNLSEEIVSYTNQCIEADESLKKQKAIEEKERQKILKDLFDKYGAKDLKDNLKDRSLAELQQIQKELEDPKNLRADIYFKKVDLDKEIDAEALSIIHRYAEELRKQR